MSRKKQLVKLLLHLNSFLAIATPLFITSCQDNNGVFDIKIDDYKQIVNEQSLSIPFGVNGGSCSSVEIEIQNSNTDKISVNPTVQLESNRGFVLVNIDPSLIDGFHARFDLNFKKQNEKGETITKIVYDLNFVYVLDPAPEKQDVVILNKTKDTEVNLHTFTYRINFLVTPQSQEIDLELTDDYSGLLHLKESKIKVQHSFDEIYIDIPVLLDFSVFSSIIMYFGLKLTFNNSYGVKQTFTHNGFILDFKKVSKDIEPIPEEYFNIEKTQGDVILHGFNENIRSEDLVSYDILQIPDDVTKIDGKLVSSDPTGNIDWSSSIAKIVFCGKEKEICQDFFVQFQNILEIDFSRYKDQVPDWLQSKTHLFDATSEINKYGYIWIDDTANETNIAQQLIACGISDKWEAMNIGKVTNEDFFNIDSENRITGISDEGKKIIQNIKLIKIPSYVTGIDSDSLNNLKTTPYFNPATNHQETRRLMLESKATAFDDSPSDGIFQNIGVSGPIIINCPNATSIGQSIFADITHYNIEKYYEVDTEASTFFSVVNLANLAEISRYAFAYSPLSNWVGNLHSISYLTKIDEYAFESHRFTSVELPKTITDVGQYAFANSYYEPRTPSLTLIDLSQFNEIINPEEIDDKLITRVPIWMSEQRCIFEGACCPSGILKLSSDIKEEVESKHSKYGPEFPSWNDWVIRQKGKLGIPSGWEIELV